MAVRPKRPKAKTKAKKAKAQPRPQTEQTAQGEQTEPQRNRGGRPTSYKPEYAKQAVKLCKLGATDKELADFFETTTVTIWRWSSAHEEFRNALKSGKAEADARVERSLYQRAVGYSFDSEKVFQFQGAIVRTDVVEHVPPSEVACFFWLKNRKPTEWRDKQEIEAKNTVYNISDQPMTEDEWAKKHVTSD